MTVNGIGSSALLPLYFIWRSSFEQLREEFILSGSQYTAKNSQAGEMLIYIDNQNF